MTSRIDCTRCSAPLSDTAFCSICAAPVPEAVAKELRARALANPSPPPVRQLLPEEIRMMEIRKSRPDRATAVRNLFLESHPILSGEWGFALARVDPSSSAILRLARNRDTMSAPEHEMAGAWIHEAILALDQHLGLRRPGEQLERLGLPPMVATEAEARDHNVMRKLRAEFREMDDGERPERWLRQRYRHLRDDVRWGLPTILLEFLPAFNIAWAPAALGAMVTLDPCNRVCENAAASIATIELLQSFGVQLGPALKTG
jgi:hypothetical protein